MKWLLLTAAALLLILGLSLGVWYYLTDSAEQVCRELDRVEQAAGAENWIDAAAALEAAGERWGELRPRWAWLTDQQQVDAVGLGLTELASLVKRRQQEEALQALNALRFTLRQAAEGERPGWENVF
ncbi:MAG: DUF4363 family protein [Firmicutes bacterium]|nr:DUF4363 family protein [Bacillota bacterium]